MRIYLTIPLATIVVTGLMLSGGCVSKVEYDKARTACRRANDELMKSQEALQAARTEKDALAQQYAEWDQTLQTKNQEIALLEAKNRDLKNAFDKLSALYENSINVPAPVGLPALPGPVDQALRAFAGENPELVEYLPNYGMVKFKSDFTFEKGKDDVSGEAVKALGKLVTILNAESAANFHVYVAGHTDDIPIKKPETLRRHPTNWYLSAHRAIEVQKVLTNAGLAPRRICAMGFGEYHPIAPNAPGKKGNSKNRRVEIWIVPPDKLLTQSKLVAEKP